MRRDLRAVVRHVVCVWTAAAIVTGGCRGPRVVAPHQPAPATATPPPTASAPGARPQIAIDAGSPQGALVVGTPDVRVAAAPASITPLSARETAALHARMEPLPDVEAAAAHAPPLRPPTPAPPRAGAVRPIAFVVPGGKLVADALIAPARVATPLAPPQITPDGDVRAESEIRVRFSEPMVPVTRVGPAARPVATIAPPVAGAWRWIDTRVAVFTAAAPRLAMATEYTVTVPAGTRAASGATLAADATATFRTPGIALAGGYPTTHLRTRSAIVVRLDQDFDPAALAPYLTVTDGTGKRVLPHDLVTLDEARARWASNPAIAFDPARAAALLGPHHVVLAPKTAWPAGEPIQVTLRAGAPSAEGPRRSTRASYARFEVAPAFTALGVTCGEAYQPRRTGARCPAGGYLRVEFSTPIALASYRASAVQIAGEPFHDHQARGSSVGLPTPDRAGRTYAIAIGDGLVDVYGQRLRGPRRLSFVTTRARHASYLEAPRGLLVLDPRFDIPQWLVHAEAAPAVRVRLYRVQPEDYFAFEAFEAGRRATPPGTRVLDETHRIGRRHGAHVRVDLRPTLGAGGLGHVIAVAELAGARPPRRAVAWLQVTRLGVASRIDGERVRAWVQDITPTSSFLAPIAGAATRLVVDRRGEVASATSDATGHAMLELPPPSGSLRPRGALLVVERAGDAVFASLDRHERTRREERALWYVTDDRFTYKPGETVHLKGWLRWTHNGVAPDLAMPRAGDRIDYAVHDARGTKLGAGTATLSAQGGFHFDVALPRTANLGAAYVRLRARGHGHTHPISIQEFRRPAFAVTLNDDVSHAGATPLVLGESLEMAASARYYAGGALAGAGVAWAATLTPTSYTPPGWSRFTFDPPHGRGRRPEPRALRHDARGSLSSASTAAIVYGVAALPGGRTSVLRVDATVTDVDRMAIRASSRPILVHPAAYYAGLRLKPGTTGVLEAIVTDLDGEPVAGVAIAIELEAVLGSERHRADAAVVDTQRCAVTSARAPVTCAFVRRDTDYAYTARATVADPRGRRHAAQLEVPWWAYDARRDLAVVPDRASYRAGDVAKLDIRSKTVPATAIVTVARQGVLAQRRVELTGPSTIVELPIELAHVPNVHVVIDRFAKRRTVKHPGLPPLPASDQVRLDLAVDVESLRLAVRARSTRKLVEPGEDATFVVDVARDGAPVADAEVALMVVDEAVLALSGTSHADPLAPFYPRVAAGTTAASTLDLVHDAGDQLRGRPGVTRFELGEYGLVGHGLFGSGAGYGAGGGGFGFATGVVTARTDFRATAVFSPLLRTDEHGRATVTVRMPDSLTRFRIVALATARDRYFGKGEGTIVSRRKVNARTVAPRFLTQGDTFSLPIVVQNLDRAPRTIELAVRAANLAAVGPAGKRVVVPGGARAEVRFDFTTRARGRAVIQTIATSGDFADASTLELPVYAPATTESFATYGIVDDAPAFERIAVPGDVFPDVGGVEVELSSTQLASLTDAFWYLYAYPYECAEQRSSRMLATAAMADLLDAFAVPGRPSRAAIEAMRATDAAVLRKEQKPDGGWGYFRGTASDPFVTQQVLTALAAHRIRGTVTQRAIRYVTGELAKLMRRLARAAARPSARRADRDHHGVWVALAAAHLTALAATGADVRPRAIRLHALATELAAYPVDAKARLLALVAGLGRAKRMRDGLVRDLLSATHETAAAATVTAHHVEAERLLLVSSTKTSALALDALLREVPRHAVIPKLARGVLDARRHGRWLSTQDNLVALQALRRYFDVHERVTPSYTGKLWLGSAAYAERGFAGRSTDRARAALGWDALAPGSTHDVALVKQGAGRMYYRIGITYAPKRVDLPALDAGFLVRRSYHAVDDPADVTRTRDGYRIRLGAKVLVRVEALNTTRRYAVALVDPIPAGFEPVNEDLAIAERAVRVVGDERWDHVNLRDERAEAFAMELREGAHRFSYTVRATTPGTFNAAPAKAEEMYSPETFGRSMGLRVTID